MNSARLVWRKSSFSGSESNCVEVASLGDGRFAIRNSNFPSAGYLAYDRAGLAAFVAAIKAGALTSRA
ncbi:DUF397 domain-containing protein [Fodinicola acaciae]|uniref:DUF397 domain-containing protein n=1 Tax=Fodinicola acaciae TaxID=2681555 RepID=UPI001C9E8F70|nr:DUF397 domain-containing protein [Fodinicola acaciae]